MLMQLIEDISYSKISLSEALLRSKLVEFKIKNETFKVWLKKELEGYDFKDESLPTYRKVHSQSWLVLSDHWGRTQNIQIELPNSYGKKVLDLIHFHRIIESTSIVEQQIRNFERVSGTLTLPNRIVKMIGDLYKPQLDPQGLIVVSGFREINKLQYQDVLDQTKNKLLDILMELDTQFPDLKNDISMDKESKDKVQNIITNNIYGGNNPMNIAAGNVVSQTVNSGFGKNEEEELKQLGVEPSEIDELKSILLSTNGDKATISEKAKKWLGSVTASVAGRGLYEGIPRIIELVDSFM